MGEGLPFIPRGQAFVTTSRVIAGVLGPANLPRYSILGHYNDVLASLERYARDRSESVLLTEDTASRLHSLRPRLLEAGVRLRGIDRLVSVYALEESR
jgi:class 3 adenylate cyclase